MKSNAVVYMYKQYTKTDSNDWTSNS